MITEQIQQGIQTIIFPQNDYAKFVPCSAHNPMCKNPAFKEFKYNPFLVLDKGYLCTL